VLAEVNLHSQVEVILIKEECEGYSGKDMKVHQLNTVKILMHSTQYLRRTIKYPA
jgi:hypothetical protein